jgi:hypothetical protein
VLAENACQVETGTSGLQYRAVDELGGEVELRKSEVMKKLESARKTRQAEKSKELLPRLEADPTSLVGQHVLHKCSEDGAPPQWYTATITSLVKKGKTPVDTQYTIKYDEEDGFYVFKLLVDLKKGDLILL